MNYLSPLMRRDRSSIGKYRWKKILNLPRPTSLIQPRITLFHGTLSNDNNESITTAFFSQYFLLNIFWINLFLSHENLQTRELCFYFVGVGGPFDARWLALELLLFRGIFPHGDRIKMSRYVFPPLGNEWIAAGRWHCLFATRRQQRTKSPSNPATQRRWR